MHNEHDRSYWRLETARHLIDEAKHYPTAELAVALAERLEALEDIGQEADDWRHRFDLAAATIAGLQAEIRALEAELAYREGGQA